MATGGAMKKLARTVFLLLGIAVICSAQRYRRPDLTDRGGVPEWEVDKDFTKDVFTFVRVQYDSSGYRRVRSSIYVRPSSRNCKKIIFKFLQLDPRGFTFTKKKIHRPHL